MPMILRGVFFPFFPLQANQISHFMKLVAIFQWDFASPFDRECVLLMQRPWPICWMYELSNFGSDIYSRRYIGLGRAPRDLPLLVLSLR
jgi:hypothetical protein